MEFDWKTLVRTVAPGIASVFGTPLAGMGVTALLNVLLPPGDAKPADPEGYIAQALQGITPEKLAQIKAAENQFQLDIKRLDIDLEKFVEENDAKDRANARTLKSDWLKSDKWDYEPLLALAVCCSFFYAEYWVFQYAVTTIKMMDSNQAILVGRMLGMIDAAFMALVYFRWGSSKSSERKTELKAQSDAAAADRAT